jgi:hypothetical protein
MTKKTKALRAHYYKRVNEIVVAHGGHLLEQNIPVDDSDMAKSVYEVMTDAGRLIVRVYDEETMNQFDRPKIAKKIARDCNPHSGKWNFHTFLDQKRLPTLEWMNAEIDYFEAAFKQLNPRAMVYTDTLISQDDFKKAGLEALKDREAFGERISIDGFDQEAFAHEYASQVTDGAGDRPEWLVDSTLRHTQNRPAIEAFDISLRWREQMQKQVKAEAPLAAMRA